MKLTMFAATIECEPEDAEGMEKVASLIAASVFGEAIALPGPPGPPGPMGMTGPAGPPAEPMAAPARTRRLRTGTSRAPRARKPKA